MNNNQYREGEDTDKKERAKKLVRDASAQAKALLKEMGYAEYEALDIIRQAL